MTLITSLTFSKEARIRKNLTQSALADRLGITYQAVSNWERGASLVVLDSVAPFLSTDALYRLADKLERITLDDYLIGLECLQPFLGREVMERLHKKVVVAE